MDHFNWDVYYDISVKDKKDNNKRVQRLFEYNLQNDRVIYQFELEENT